MYKDIFESIRNEAEKRNLRERTIQLYCSDVSYFLRWIGKNVSDLTLEDAESFLTAKRLEGRSPETHNHYRSAIKFLYKKVLKIVWDDDTVPAMKRERNLPAVLSRDEINAIIDVTPNLKHKAIIATMYSSGLRVSEVVHLHYDDISRTNMTIHVRETKGRIDRYTILSQKNLDLLTEYWYKCGRPKDIRIYFIGMPVMLIYNFGAAVLRAIGDTRRPLYYLLEAGVVNVILNLVFVIGFQMGVAGVAIATVVSQCISAALIVRCLMKSEGMYRLYLKRIRIHKEKMIRIIQIGLPAGLQGAIFSISNVLIQSSINSFGAIAMAGNTAAGNIEGFVYVSMNAIYQTALSFVSQNVGAGQQKRIPKISIYCMAIVFTVGLALGTLAYRCGGTLLGIYSSDPEVIAYGLDRMKVICQIYFLCGMMDVAVGILRGMGYSIMPMLVSLAGACGLRIVWIFTVFVWKHSLFVLYLSYPITWIITLSVHLICFAVVWKRKKGIWATVKPHPDLGKTEE